MEEKSAAFHFGDWLKRQIEGQALQQKEFATKARIGFGALRLWIGSKAPNIRGANLVKLARALGVTREELERKLAEAFSDSGLARISETGTKNKIPLLDSPFRNMVNGMPDARSGFISASIVPFSDALRAVVVHGSIYPMRHDAGELRGATAFVVIIDPIDLSSDRIVPGAAYVIWLVDDVDRPLFYCLKVSSGRDEIIGTPPPFYTAVKRRRFKVGQIARIAVVKAAIDYMMIPAPPGPSLSDRPR